MAKYTTQVRSICESVCGLTESVGFTEIEDVIKQAAPKIFGTNWPIFDEQYRLTLETLILRHYYTREISEETVGLWKLRLVDRLNLIMPYYNQLYESEKLKFEPLNDVDYTDTGNSSGNTNSTSNTKTNTKNTSHQENDTVSDTSDWQLYSDTPQGGVVGIANAEGSVADNTYLTNAEHDIGNVKTDTTIDGNSTGDSNTDATGNVSNLEEYTEHIAGKRGSASYSRLLKEFRETFLNINMRIVDDLNDLFFGLWE